MTSAFTHVTRVIGWGRVLARHGALRPLEADPRVPARVRLLARLARVGTFAPRTPRYAPAFAALGPAAIKLGQALATRPDLIGAHAAHDLLTLQDRLPPAPWGKVEPQIDRELGRPWRELFASIEPQPIGAASIAQVHRATTTDGRQVALKVLRPGIEARFTRDLDTYGWLADRLEAQGGEFARLRPRATLAMFRTWTETELDLRREAAAASELTDALRAEPGWFVPAIDWPRTARRLLTTEWMPGTPLTDTKALAAMPFDRAALGRTLVRGFLRQAIGRGYFHADLHQGNLFLRPDGRLGVIDFGIMGRLDRRARTDLAQILFGLLTGDYVKVADVHFDAGFVPGHHSRAEFATALRAVGEPIRGQAAKDISVANLLDGLFALTRAFDMPTQPHLLLLQKTMVMVEGVALTLDPQVNMWAAAEPYVRDWMRGELGPEARAADAITGGLRALFQLPGFVRRVEKLVPDLVAAPPLPTLPQLELKVRARVPLGYVFAALAGAMAGAGGLYLFG